MKYGLAYTLMTRTTGFLSRTIGHFRSTELKYICDLLENKKNIRILDYGCNTGYFLNMINKRYTKSNFQLCGADINSHALKYARRKYPNFTFFEIDDDFFERQKFDVIILSHVLEHVKERNNFISNLRRLFKKNGELIIAIPQERFRGDCTLFQWGMNILMFRFENPHVVKFNYSQLSAFLDKNGFKIKEHVYTHFLYPFKTGHRRLDSWSLVAKCEQVSA